MENAISNKSVDIKRDNSIAMIRVVSMFLIILTHFIREIEGIAFISQVTNAAIYTFLFISGYLLGKKQIINSEEWLRKRFSRILVPSYFFLLILFFYKFIVGKLELTTVLIYLFNLQGLFGGTNGAGHFWFMTTIMFCYFITPLLNKYRTIFLEKTKPKQLLIATFFVFLWIIISLKAPVMIGNNLGYLLFYSFAYYLGNVWDRKITNRNFIIITMVTTLSLVFRGIMRSFFNDTNLYDVVTVSITQSVLGVYIFIFLDRLKSISNNQSVVDVINHFDKISYEMFITHYAFITGPFYIWGISNNVIIDSTLVLIATYISANILKYISDSIILKTSTAKI